MKENPYVGPRSIGGKEHEEEKLYGREREVGDLLDLVIAERIVLLYSPSGAGKTSLLQAGLAPALTKRRFHVRPIVRVHAEPPPEVEFDPSWGNRYALSTLLSLEIPRPARELARLTLFDALDEAPNGEVLIFDQFEEVITADPLDHGEKAEFFGQLGDILRVKGRWAVFAMREDYLATIDPYLDLVPTRFSNTFRLDLLKQPAAVQAIRGPAAERGIDFKEDAAQALARNLSEIQVQYADDRPADAKPGIYVEPVQLQVVCRRLWEGLPAGTPAIEISHLTQAGDVDSALRGYYDDSVSNAAKESGITERELRDWFRNHLLTPQKTRSQVSQGEADTTRIRPALEWLIKSHLVRPDRRLGSLWYELAHDRLVRPVLDSNAEWFDRNLSDLQKRTALWADKDRPDGLLAVESGQLATWESVDNPGPGTVERDYLDRSRASLRRERNRKLLTVAAAVLGVLAIIGLSATWIFSRSLNTQAAALDDQKRKVDAKQRALTAAIGMIAVESKQKNSAEAGRKVEFDRAQSAEQAALREAGNAREQAAISTSRRLGTTVVLQRDKRFDVAALLSLAAWKQAPTGEALSALQRTYSSNRHLVTMLHHDSNAQGAAFGPGNRIAVACGDGSVWIWDVITRRPLVKRANAHAGGVSSVAFNSKGLLVSAGKDGNLRLWNGLTGAPIGSPVRAHQGRANTVSFDAGGEVLASGGEDKLVRLWRVTSSGITPVGDGLPDSLRAVEEVKRVAISLRKRQVAAASVTTVQNESSTLYSWDLGNAQRPVLLAPGKSEDVTYSSADGQLVGVIGDGNYLHWPASAPLVGEPFAKGHGDYGWNRSAAFQIREGKTSHIATSSDDRVIRFWNLPPNSTAPVLELRGPETRVLSMAFDAGGDRLASISENDHSVWIWDTAELGQARSGSLVAGKLGTGPVSAAFDPAGRTMLAAWNRELVQFQRTSNSWVEQRRVALNSGGGSDWRSREWSPWLAFSPVPDRPFVVVGEYGGTVTLRRKDSLQVIAKVEADGGWHPAGVAVSHDAKLLAVSDWQGRRTLRIYSLENLEHPRLLHELDAPPKGADLSKLSPMEGMAFHPRKNLLAVGGNSMMGNVLDPHNIELRLWDLTDSAKPRVAGRIPSVGVIRILFSPDGEWLAVARTDSGLGIWRLKESVRPSGEKLVEFAPHASLAGVFQHLSQFAFSPDSRIIAAGGNGKDFSRSDEILLWDVGTGTALEPVRFPGETVAAAAFDPTTGQLMVTSSRGEMRSLELDPKDWIRDLCARANRNFTDDEWRYWVNTPPEKVCPDTPR